MDNPVGVDVALYELEHEIEASSIIATELNREELYGDLVDLKTPLVKFVPFRPSPETLSAAQSQSSPCPAQHDYPLAHSVVYKIGANGVACGQVIYESDICIFEKAALDHFPVIPSFPGQFGISSGNRDFSVSGDSGSIVFSFAPRVQINVVSLPGGLVSAQFVETQSIASVSPETASDSSVTEPVSTSASALSESSTQSFTPVGLLHGNFITQTGSWGIATPWRAVESALKSLGYEFKRFLP